MYLCIVKVNGGLCPQCRVPFGTVRIRNRLFEEMLDSQEFDCKFQERGCVQVCKRGEITAHSNSCLYNPDTVSVCEQLGLGKCKFRLGCISRVEVISHFEQVHKCPFKLSSSLNLIFPGKSFMKMMGRKRKARASRVANPSFLCVMSSKDALEFSPLFLIFGKIKQSTGYLALYCIKAWESPSNFLKNFKVDFCFLRDPSIEPLPGSAPEQSTSSWISSLPTTEYNPYPLYGMMRVGGIKDVRVLLMASTVNLPISLLEDHQFGSLSGDDLHAMITPLNEASDAPVVLPESGATRSGTSFTSSSHSISTAGQRQLLQLYQL